MAITAAGVGSGLDIETIVTQLMSLERRPLVNLQRKESEAQAQISAFGSLKSAVSSFRDAMGKLGTADKFKIFTPVSSDESILTATATSSAAGGSYNLDVQRLAQNHKQGSSAFAPGTSFGGAGGDSLTLTVNGNASTIDLSTAVDLAGVRDAINGASDNPGVTATIINDGSNEHLVITADESGYDQRLELSYGGSINAATFNFGTLNQDDTGATLADLTQLDASFSVDGIAITAASNQAAGVVDGLTFDLKGVGKSTLSVDRDTDSIEASAQEFVDAYNAVLQKVDELKSGTLGSDSSLRSIVSQFRSVLNTSASGLTGAYSSLSEIGITTNKDTGELELDASKFSNALDTDFSAVSDVFTDTGSGYSTRFIDVADGMLQTEGLLNSRVDTLNTRVRGYQNQQSSMEANLILKEKSMRAQYAALDSLIGSLNSTSAFLSANLVNSGA